MGSFSNDKIIYFLRISTSVRPIAAGVGETAIPADFIASILAAAVSSAPETRTFARFNH